MTAPSIAWRDDTATLTYQDLTGVSHDDAVTALQAAGYQAGQGIPVKGLRDALEAAGYQVADATGLLDLETARVESGRGRLFYVAARKGHGGTAWAIVDGHTARAQHGAFRHRLYELTRPADAVVRGSHECQAEREAFGGQ